MSPDDLRAFYPRHALFMITPLLLWAINVMLKIITVYLKIILKLIIERRRHSTIDFINGGH